jgi:hypothetical protein
MYPTSTTIEAIANKQPFQIENENFHHQHAENKIRKNVDQKNHLHQHTENKTFHHLNKQELLQTTEKLVREERRISGEILECLHEIETRFLHAEMGYSSLYEFCVKHLRYSEGSAHRRISAMRVLKNLPTEARKSTEEKIKTGSITVSNLSLMHSFIKQAKKQNLQFNEEQKTALLQQIENQGKREAEKKLYALTPELEQRTEIRFHADQSLLEKLSRVKEITAHKVRGSDMGEILHRLADDYLQRHDPEQRANRVLGTSAGGTSARAISAHTRSAGATSEDHTSPATKRCEILKPDKNHAKNQNSINLTKTSESTKVQNSVTRHIPAPLKHLVWIRDRGRCTFKTKTHTCGSRYGLEFEHLQPFALGGTHTPENLTLRCRTHNQWSAIKYGLNKK